MQRVQEKGEEISEKHGGREGSGSGFRAGEAHRHRLCGSKRGFGACEAPRVEGI